MDVSRVLTALAATLALMAASAGAASAATVSVVSGTLRYQAGLGEINTFVLSRSGSTWSIADLGADTIVPDDVTCHVVIDDNRAECSDPVQDVLVQLGGEDDTATLDASASAPGGTRLDGGDGNDVLLGGGGADVLVGGTGSDVMSGGGGVDTVTYADRSAPLAVAIDDLAGDGEAGENDDVRSDVERVVGGSGADTLVGNIGANALDGGPGEDVLDGGAGPDALAGGDGVDTVTYGGRAAAVTVRLDGLPDDGEAREGDNVSAEVVVGGGGADTLVGDGAANVLDGGAGDDLVDGGAGPDRLTGGPGQDVLLARDGAADTVDCGGGLDFAAADPVDAAAACEEAARGAPKARLRDTAVVRAVRGRVTIRFPRTVRFVPLAGTLQIPLGSEIDTTDGFARLTTARNRSGATQAATFYEGRFIVRQGGGREPVTDLRLSGGDFSRCGLAAGSGRHLWGREGGRRGKYRTRGRWSSGTVRGTTWLTQDTCAGTLTRVTKGRVIVRDLVRKRTVMVRAGHRYLARARGR
jgi:Ca2+-binding RTX toxin-like protein